MQKNCVAEYYYDDYNPFFIDDVTFDILRDSLYGLPLITTNCILLMNTFDLKTVNPTHPTDDPEAPTDVIFFCIRFIENDKYQPIGGLLTYSDRDQSDVIADCIHRILKDLYEMGINVLCSVSPHYKIFKNVIRVLNPDKNYDKDPDVMYYPISQKNRMIHLFDAELLMNKFHRIFMARDIAFRTSYGPRVNYYAIWSDIFYTLDKTAEFKVYLNFLLWKGYWPRKVQYFPQSIWLHHIEYTSKGLLSPHAYSGTILLSVINAYMGIFSYDFLMPDQFETCWKEIMFTFENMAFINHKNFETIDKINNIKIPLNEQALRLSSEVTDNRENEKKKNSPVAKPKIALKVDTNEKLPERDYLTDSIVTNEVVEDKSETDSVAVLVPHSIQCKSKNCTGCVITVDLNLSKKLEDLHESSNTVKTVMGAHLMNCNKKNCTGCVETDYQTKKLVNSADLHEPAIIPVECGNNAVKPSTGAIKKSTSRKRRKKKTETEQNARKINSFIVEDQMIADVLGDETKSVELDQQWEVINIFKRIKDIKGVTKDANGENCTLPCINGRDISWEEPLNIDVDQESVKNEILCTVKGTAYFISMLLQRNISRIKANSMLVEPIEEMVTRIQKCYNKMRFVEYFGRPYQIFDEQVFPYTLRHNKSLYLIKKD
ncbi:uncharacterized protein LOC130449609 [Diorhabda sublineata]|uniref:uncharacterized protein LOC130449609 n=1 Tax=Diorhabda sublineata TaxID=1163346 RepID=UPI0024E05127|nr:uncharacterized protein LOC130449609 [Diorhabda sublineata]